MSKEKTSPAVVIVGGGFGGLYAAKALGNRGVAVTLIDRRNFHLFQPLLYQVATGGLSPGDIASPLRGVLGRYGNIRVLQEEVTGLDPENKKVLLESGEIVYDYLLLAAGTRHHYFGNDQWEKLAPGLKTVEDALEMRRRIFNAFEKAEAAATGEEQKRLSTFVIVGGGPTGVELAGAMAELAYGTLRRDFRNFDPTQTRIVLVEAGPRLLPPYAKKDSQKARLTLEKKGVEVRTATAVKEVREGAVILTLPDKNEETIAAETVLWGAGVVGTPLATTIAGATGVETDRQHRLPVGGDLSLANFPEIMVLGDMAHFEQDGQALPGVAQVAMQQGRYAARRILAETRGETAKPFRYKNKGNMAVIGRNAAIADLGFASLSGLPAWLIWVFVHIAYLIGYDNRILVLVQWASNYFTRKRGARLITLPGWSPGEEKSPG
ncbi:MAG TPA: NAD(P)/FAD-dependent oxidoreductase [Calditrichia bacterium]|nr:NAD(P)/FAD-dependent oxidoreductase [Calditrichia bacterium]